MRDETKQKLDTLHRRDRITWVVTLSIASVLAIAFGYVAYMQPVISERAIVVTVTVATGEVDVDTGQRFLSIQARLDDGRLVRVRGGFQGIPPKPASRIVVQEKVSPIWGHSYTWTGEVRP